MSKLPDTITIDGVPYSRRDVIPAPIKPRQIDWSKVADIVPVKVCRENGLSAIILYPALSDTGYPDTTIWSKRSLITSIWIPWFGGECPLPEGVICSVVLRDDGGSGRGINAESTDWQWRRDKSAPGGDIIAFRVTGIAQGRVE